MGTLWNYNIKENMKFIFILKFFTLMLLTWICYLKSDKFILGISIENEYKFQRMSVESFNRILAKHVFQEELRMQKQSEFFSDNLMKKNMKNALEITSNYGELNKRKKNNLDSYKKEYRRRYSKKNIIGKLECYCEKKVFEKIDDIIMLSEKMQHDKKRLIKEILKKHCKGFIILTSILLIGIIIHILFTGAYGLIPWCVKDFDSSVHTRAKCSYTIHAKQETFNAIQIPNFLLFSLLSITLISVVIYTLIKLVKYERLKMGRGKMNTKDYIKFCKEVFN